MLEIDLDTPGLAVVSLSRPDALNALSRDLRDRLADAFAAFETDPSVRVVILTGHGRAFCAGIDVKELSTLGLAAAGEVRDPLAAIGRFPGPVIGAINGAAITGGFELALACDVLLASTDAWFADTHARIGILPGWGLSQRLPRIAGAGRAKELAFTGRRLPAAEAERWGVVNRVLPADELLPAARAMAAEMLAMPVDLVRAYKRLIDDGLALGFGEGMRLEAARAGERNARVRPEDVAQQRDALFDRGRAAGPRT